MPTSLVPGSWDPSSTLRALPKPPTRKPPPSPLAISSSSVTTSRLQPPAISADPSPSVSTSTNTGRNSLESSRSDLTSVRSEITSRIVSEFPIPPSALPPIPASPRTPMSIQFSTTPRSQSPQSGFAYQQQHPPGAPMGTEHQGAGSPFLDPQHGYDPSRSDGPARYSQYAVYKESNAGASTSRPATPTTAGTMTPRDWPSSDGRESPLQPPRPAYAGARSPTRSHSPLRNDSFATQQEEASHPLESLPSPRSHSPSHPPRSVSPQPPRSPLPIPPRDSARYSHIARRAGVSDMGMDISEEDLLSTDFITGLLNQPASASPRSARSARLPESPRSARFPRTPESPRSPALSNITSDETYGLSGHIGTDEMRLASRQHSAPNSPGPLLPNSISGSDAGLLSPTRYADDSPGLQIYEAESPLPSSVDGAYWTRPAGRRMQSGLASSVFPNGGDRVYEEFRPTPSLPTSPNVLTVPENRLRNHASPHPLMPSTPMTPESFAIASPRSPQGFAHAQAKHLPTGRNSFNNHSLAVYLPIGGRPSSGTTPAAASPRLAPSPRIRQHHYPRHGAMKTDAAPKGPRTQDHSQRLQSMTYPPRPAGFTPSLFVEPEQDISDERDSAKPAQVRPLRSTVTSIAASAASFSSSTRTQRGSSPASLRTVETDPVPSSVAVNPDEGYAPGTLNESRRSVESNVQSSTENGQDDDGISELEGEVQTASRVWGGTTSPIITQLGDVNGPTVVGVAPAVLLQHNSVEPRETEGTGDAHLEVTRTASGLDLGASPPPSPHDPPSIHLPPSHRTDIPESVKSNIFSDDAHGTQRLNPLPHGEAANYGTSSVPWNVKPNASPISPSSRVPLSRQSSNKASSFKTVVSYITSRSRTSTLASKVSKRSNKSTGSSRWHWLKRKPLPPLPPTAIRAEPKNVWQGPVYDESVLRHEAGLQLPDLAQRAGNLRKMLERDQNPSMSRVSVPRPGEPQGWSEDGAVEKGQSGWHDESMFMGHPGMAFTGTGGKFEMLAEDSLKVAKRTKPKKQKQTETSDYGTNIVLGSQHQGWRSGRRFQALGRHNARKRFWIPLIAVIIIAIILGVALGTTLGRKQGSGGKAATCSGNMAGARCNLDATCVCPLSQSSGCSAPLARALVELIPITSQLFTTNITAVAVSLVLWGAQGAPADQSCISQTDLIDVGSVLDNSVSPNRTQWAQAALLWSLFESGDIQASQKMQIAVGKLPYQSLQTKDGPETDSSNKFTVDSSGYTFNFATQTVNAPQLKFRNDASPSATQLGELNSAAQSSLDRMYSFASASSTQSQSALGIYWRYVLSLPEKDLETFILNFKSAPILLPFDATLPSISGLLANATNTTLSFPPPIGCFPGLTSSQVQRVSAVETEVFGLPALTSAPSSFDSSCFVDRPSYGVLDVLRTRLPFGDSRSGVAKQAAVLTSDASSRAVLRVGELLSALPATNVTDLSPFSLDPRQFGTLTHVNQTALKWLQSFPTPSFAVEAAKFVISSPSSPPSPTSILFNSTSIPTVEVAVFGEILLSDLSAFVSSLSTPSGALFFGSSQGDTFRHWALQQSSSATINWSENNFASKVVNEASTIYSGFESVWSEAASLISNGSTGPSQVSQVVNAFFGPQ